MKYDYLYNHAYFVCNISMNVKKQTYLLEEILEILKNRMGFY